MSNQPHQTRQSAGTPAGGQFAISPRPEADVDLADAAADEPYHLWFHHEPCGATRDHDAHLWGEQKSWCIGEPSSRAH